MSRVTTEGPTPRAQGFRLPAEWEPHAATWIAWPSSPRDWPGKEGAIPWVFAEIVRHLSAYETVRILVPDASARTQIRRSLRSARVDVDRCEFLCQPVNRTWTRDYLPTFVVREGDRGREVGAVKWRFTGWARYPNHHKDDRAGEQVMRLRGGPAWLPEVEFAGSRQRVVLEGGAIDGDGEGTLLGTRQCLLTGPWARNGQLGRSRMERVLSDYLGVDRVIWLPDGIAGDDTSGHVDDFVRFVGPGRLVLCEETRAADGNYRPLRQAAQILARKRDARGRRLEVIRLPMPRPLFFKRERLPASYANFYIANGVVLVPTFNDPRDAAALGILAAVFPQHEVVGIHCVDLVLGLGTVHCSTMQEPLASDRGPDRATILVDVP